MFTAEFLQAVFPLAGPDDPRAGELVRFVVFSQDVGWAKAPHHYRTRGELHAGNERGVGILGFDARGKDVYFTPHGVTTRDATLTKAAASPLGDCCWLELDDTDIPPANFSPPPSLVVETSPNRYHLYWLLDAPLPTDQIEAINHRLVYAHRLHVDKGGWALTKWLRVPGTVSYKRQDGFAVGVVDALSDPGRRYAAAAFADLPEIAVLRTPLAARPVPNVSAMPGRDELLKRFPLTREAIDLIAREREDRSAALWRLEKLLYRAGVPEEDAYAIVAGSANDKYHVDWRYKADDDLWQDIQKAYAELIDPEDLPYQIDLKKIRAQTMPASEKHRRLAGRIMQHMGETGRFFVQRRQNTRECLYFDGRDLITIDDHNQPWQTLLNLRYDVNSREREFPPVTATIRDRTTEEGENVEVHDFAFYDERGTLYVSLGGARLARLAAEDGQPRLDVVDNGTDGVLFRDAVYRDPVLPVAPTPADACPSLVEAIFGLPNYQNAVVPHSRLQAEHLAEIWTYSLFFTEYLPSRPHLILVGPAGSGKTVLFQMLLELFEGPGRRVMMVPDDKASFQTAASNARYLFLDNVDEEEEHRWLVNKLAEIASGTSFRKRRLYSNNESLIYTIECFLGLTTRDAWFSRIDVAERSIPLYADVWPTKTNLNDLLKRLRRHRPHLLHTLLGNLGKIVVGLDQYAGHHDRTMRMAGFGDFIEVACAALGWDDAADLIRIVEENQQDTALSTSLLVGYLDAWLNAYNRGTGLYPHHGRQVDAGHLWQELYELAKDKQDGSAFKKKIGNAKSLGQAIRHEERLIRQKMGFDREIRGNKLYYRFFLPDGTEPAVTA